MEKLLNVQIEDKFKVAKGLVLTGIIDVKYYGELETGNYIEFEIEGETLIRKVIAVDYFTLPMSTGYIEIKTRNVGLLIECDNEDELNKILETKSIRQTATIYNNKK